MLRILPAVLLALSAVLAPLSARSAERQPLKVLYAGNPGSEREKEYVGFLQRNFEKVGTGSFSRFKPADADGYDVVILDWSRIYEPGTGLRLPARPTLPASYDRPTLLVGGAGATLGAELHLKLDWL